MRGGPHIHHIAGGKRARKNIPNYDAVVNVVRKQALDEIESETRRMRKITAEIPNPKGREAGKQDWTDLPQNAPIQKHALDQLGIVLRPNAPYICPKCKMKYMGLPPEYCSICKRPTYFHFLNLRR
jgi:hypothetical protein